MIDFLTEYSEYVKAALAVVAVVMSFMIGWIFRPYDGAEYEEMRHKINTLRIDAINYQSSIEANALTVRMQREMIDNLNLDLDRIKSDYNSSAKAIKLSEAHMSKLNKEISYIISVNKDLRDTIHLYKSVNLDLEKEVACLKKDSTGTKAPSAINQFKEVLSPHMGVDILSDFCAHRRAKKAAFTATAAKMFLKAANDCGMTPNQAAATAIERNWITVKPEWLKNSSRWANQRNTENQTAKPKEESVLNIPDDFNAINRGKLKANRKTSYSKLAEQRKKLTGK